MEFIDITSNYGQYGYPIRKMSFDVSSIFGVSMNKIALWISVRVDDWTAERAIIASNIFLIQKKN